GARPRVNGRSVPRLGCRRNLAVRLPGLSFARVLPAISPFAPKSYPNTTDFTCFMLRGLYGGRRADPYRKSRGTNDDAPPPAARGPRTTIRRSRHANLECPTATQRPTTVDPARHAPR